jgi:hypothetical protein
LWQDKFYEVLGEQPGKPPHHFIYRLRRSPPGRVVRAVHPYDPHEVLREQPARPGFVSWLGEVAQERWAKVRAGREPPKPDIVESCPGVDFQLRIASERPKEGWDSLITIEYQNEYFEVCDRRQGPSAYPYVYLLRRLPPGRIIRTVYHYRPEDSLADQGGRAKETQN